MIMLLRSVSVAMVCVLCGGDEASIFSTARYLSDVDKVIIYYILLSESVEEGAVAVGSMKIRTISISCCLPREMMSLSHLKTQNGFQWIIQRHPKHHIHLVDSNCNHDAAATLSNACS